MQKLKAVLVPVAWVTLGVTLGVAIQKGEASNKLPPPLEREFSVTVLEVSQRLTKPWDFFQGEYEQEFTLTDGSKKKVRVKPVIKEEKLWYEIHNNDYHNYAGDGGLQLYPDLAIIVYDHHAKMAQYFDEQGKSYPPGFTEGEPFGQQAKEWLEEKKAEREVQRDE